MLDACRQPGDLEDFLLLLDLQRHMRRHGVHQAARLIDAVQGGKDLGRHLLAQLHVLLELAQQTANEDFRFPLAYRLLIEDRNLGTAMGVLFDKALDLTALLTFDQYLDRTVRKLEQLQHGGHGTHAIEPIFARIVIGRVLLRQEQDLLVTGHCGLKGLDGLLPSDEQRDDHVRIHHYVTQGEQGQLDECFHDIRLYSGSWPKTSGKTLGPKMGLGQGKNKRGRWKIRKEKGANRPLLLMLQAQPSLAARCFRRSIEAGTTHRSRSHR
ncbi:hypothetical protein D9M71_313040 [compost metagenome]